MSRYGCKTTRRILILSNALSGGGAESVARLMVQRLEGASCVLFENNARVEVSGRQIWVASRIHRGSLVVTLLANLWRLVVIQWVKLKLVVERCFLCITGLAKVIPVAPFESG